ncbi:MAG: STAS domain-containing protein [candidate division Zixibacteria bacterium]|nr:STAS domain-containing protein [Candidatus Tariuqbacter arcticus]
MEVEITTEGDSSHISVTGRIDSYSSPDLEKQIDEKLPETAKFAILNLAGLEYISSAGLRIILMLQKRLKVRGGEAVIAAPPDFVKKILHISGFNSIFQIFETLDQATAYMKKQAGV